MQGHRLLGGFGILIVIVAVLYLLVAIGVALWLGNRGFGSGWGTGWTGWLTIPLAGGAVFAALTLLVFGLMLFFLAKIDDNLALAERRRMENLARPRVQPAAAQAHAGHPAVAASVAEAAAPAAATAVITAAAVAPEERVVEEPGAPWAELVAEPDMPAPGAEIEAGAIEEPDLSAVETAPAATVLPSVEMEEAPDEAVLAASVLGDEAAEPELTFETPDVELARADLPDVEVSEVAAEVEAVDLSGVDIPEITVPEVLDPEIAVDAAEVESPRVDVPRVEASGFAATIEQADLAGVDMPEFSGVDDLNVPPVLPEEIELPRVDVSSPEAGLDTEDMSGEDLSTAAAALAAGAAFVASDADSGRMAEVEPEPVVMPAHAARLPEVEIIDMPDLEPESASALTPSEATLAAATGIPETEAAAPPPAEASEVAQLRAEVASLKEMLAQLAAQLLPTAGAAAAGAAVGAAAGEENQVPHATAAPVEPPPAPGEAAARLPGADEVARIAAEVNAAQRRPRTVARPNAPDNLPADRASADQTPAPVERPAPETLPAVPAASEALPPGEDNLEVIAGLGPIYAKRLRELGVTTFAQLAEAPYDVLHKVTRGNLERVIKEDWRGQARRLARKE